MRETETVTETETVWMLAHLEAYYQVGADIDAIYDWIDEYGGVVVGDPEFIPLTGWYCIHADFPSAYEAEPCANEVKMLSQCDASWDCREFLFNEIDDLTAELPQVIIDRFEEEIPGIDDPTNEQAWERVGSIIRLYVHPKLFDDPAYREWEIKQMDFYGPAHSC